MRLPIHRHLANRRGAVLPLVAFSLVALLSMAALAVDLGMLYNARAEAQRAADAAALAGASVYKESTTPVEGNVAAAEARALSYATQNDLLGRAVENGEVTVFVDDADSMVTVNVSRANVPTLFAGLFGRNFANVGASASAQVTTTGTVACIKPFAIPQGTYDDTDVGTKVLLWESGNNASAPGTTEFILVGNEESHGGNVIRDMLENSVCDQGVQVGSDIEVQPSNTALGNVNVPLGNIIEEYGAISWSSTGQYDGFNRSDWSTHPLVAVIPLYDPATLSDAPGYDEVTITGFMRLLLDSQTITCRARTANPCVYATSGNRDQLYATILPATGLPDDCVATGCGSLTLTLRLVK